MKQKGFVQIIVIILVVLAAIAGAYYFGTKNKVVVAPVASVQPSSGPVATVDPTVSWKIYTNNKYYYEFKCPNTSTHKVYLTNGNGNDKPLYQEVCYEQQKQIEVNVYPKASTISISQFTDGANAQEMDSTDFRVFLRGFDKSYFNQILSTFKFTK